MIRIRAAIVPVIGGLIAALAFTFAQTAGATTQQMMTDLTGVPVPLGPAICVPGNIVITGIGHDHSFTNPNGDSWENATVQGTAVTDGSPSYSGHAEAWFGTEFNNGAQVSHFKASVNLSGGPRIQMNGQMTVNANGIPVVGRMTVNCS